MRFYTKYLVSLFIIIFVVIACKHDVGQLTMSNSLNSSDPTKNTFDSTSNFAGGCDSTKINYVEHIKPIMTKYCTNCHNSTLKLGGYDLSTYAVTALPAKSGKLLGAVQHASGFIAMPSTTQFISACEVSLIKSWITQSYLYDSIGSKASDTIVSLPVDNTVKICNPDTVYFASQMLPLMISSCAMSGCHDVISHKEGVILTDYTNIMRVVKAGNPSSSKLYQSLLESGSDRMPRAPVPAFTQAQISLVAKWIQQGAKNNFCVNNATVNCVTNNMSFSKDIQPILVSNCTGCHNATAPSAGINLTNFTGTKTISARLVGSITHAAGYVAMPTSTIKLSPCDINKISAWITQGTLNN